MQGVGQCKDHEAAGYKEDRIEAGGEVDPVDQLQHHPATAQTDHATDAELAHQMHQQIPVQTGFAAGKHVDKSDGEEHRHWVITAGFDFEAGGHPLVQALAAQQREHRRRIGGADNGADQKALHHVQVEQPGGCHAGQPGGNQHPDRGQRQRRP